MSDPLEYMNRFAQWTVEEDVPEYNTQWAGKLAEACVEIANRDDQIATLRAENERLTTRLQAAEGLMRAAKDVCNHPLHIGDVPDSFVDELVKLDRALVLAAALQAEGAK